MSQKIKTSVEIDGYARADHFRVSTSSAEPLDVGKIVWNQVDGTFDMGLIGGVTLQAGQEMHMYGKASEAIANGDAIMFAGIQGDHILFAKAEPTAINANPEYFIGIATQDFTLNQFGYVTVFGNVRTLDTTAYTLGAVLYFASNIPMTGKLTATRPDAPNAKITVAAVARVHATQGMLIVRPHVMPRIQDLQNVLATSPNNNEVLVYEGIPSNVWKPKSISTILGYTPANDSSVVHKTGDETIYGFKTFIDNTYSSAFLATNYIDTPLLYVGSVYANYVSSGGNIVSYGDTYAGYFYDINDSAYYLNPNGSSNLYNVTANQFIKSGGTSAQFLKADGSVDSNSYYLASNPNGYITSSGSISGNAATATYSANSSKIYSTDVAYAYGSANPYYGYLTYNGSANRWRFKVSPATPDSVEVAYADNSGLLSGTSLSSIVWYNGWVSYPGYDANTILGSKSGFTYANNAPYNGPLAHIEAGGYGLQLNAPYGGTGSGFAFRTRNGDNATWNSWYYPAVYGVNGGGSLYATVLYDSNNTGYYLDPASTSNISGLNVNGSVSVIGTKTLTITPTSGGVDLYSTGNFAPHYQNTVTWYTGVPGSGTSRATLETNGSWTSAYNISTVDSRAPIFYDQNNTSYYLDPASTSNINTLSLSNISSNFSIFGGYGPGSGPGLAFENQNSFARIVFWNLDFYEWDSGQIMTMNNGYVQANNSFRAPIFYDSNDTAYYLNPADADVSGVLKGTLTVGGGTGGNYDEGIRIVDSNGFSVLGFGMSGNAGIGRFQWVKTSGDTFQLRKADGYVSIETDQSAVTYINNQLRTPLMYDLNDTGYYIDPNSSSKIQNLSLVRSGGGSDPYGVLGVSCPSGDNYAYIGLTRNGVIGMAMGIDTSSNFWIGTSGGGHNSVRTGTYITITTGGTFTATGDVVAYSDRRVKENINTIDNALYKVLSLRGVTYNRIDKEDKSEKIGVIAQEIQEILPQVVQEQEDGMLGVSYGNITAVLIEAIKEQQTQIEELKQLVNQLIQK